jgi:hypothetical protein
LFFVTEGPTNRVKKLLDKEVQRAKRVLPNVPIKVFNAGNGAGQIPLKKLRGKIAKSKIVLSKEEVAAIEKRIHALGALRLPIPKGIDPTKTPKGVNPRALRGK